MLPSGLFVLAAAHEGRRAGIVARSVQLCADDPLLISVTVRCGHWIASILRDARTFAIWRVDASEGLMLKKFADPVRPRSGDPFDGLALSPLVTGAPILASSQLAIDCEVFRHIDLEADHELFVGKVVAGRVRSAADLSVSPAANGTPQNGQHANGERHRALRAN
jgi:flavin reductase (DIM6/NTAB) family NADH-FMN oxidoreductase RutF